MEVHLLVLLVMMTGVSSTLVCDLCDCEVLEHLEMINCSSRGLHHNFPDLQQWPNETQQQVGVEVSVGLERNNIRRVDQFPLLPSVVRLSLAHNAIMDIASHAFLKLESLTHLDLSYNHLTGDSVRADVLRGSYRSEVYEPMELISLNLAYNEIHSLERKAFEHLPHLQELYLTGNPLRVLDVPTIIALGYPTALKILDLSATGLSAISDQFVHLPSLKKLEVLILSANNFTDVPEELSALGSSLWELNLNDNPIVELDQDSLLGLRRLRVLSISGMPRLQRIGPAVFDEMDNLETLFAAHNPHLSDIDVDAFRNFKDRDTFKELHLAHCALDGLPEGLLSWEQLDIVDIQSNPWLCDCEMQWMTSRLVPHIVTKDPEHSVDLHCQSPQWLAGVSLQSLSVEPEGGRAPLCAPEPRPRPTQKRARARSFAATIVLATATSMCCVAAIAACVVCYRRMRVFRPSVLGTVVYVPMREDGKF